MAAPRFLIAKYAPNLRRMEPRNIGVILWSECGVAAHFAGQGESGDIVPPSFIKGKSRGTYRRWVRYWLSLLHQAEIALDPSHPISMSDPQFINAIKETSRGNYFLLDGGFFADDIASDDLKNTARELFYELVTEKESADQYDATRVLAHNWKHVLRESGLRSRQDFKEQYAVPLSISGVDKSVEFTCGLGNGVPTHLFQKANVVRADSAYSAIFKIEAVTKLSGAVPKERCFAVVIGDVAELNIPDAKSTIELLGLWGTVLDVSDTAKAVDTILQSLNGSE